MSGSGFGGGKHQPTATVSDRDAWLAANPNLAEGLLDIEDMEISMMQTAEVAYRRYRLESVGSYRW
jgi:hypothetical protein